ncbi:melanoma-associated antigen 10-like [Cavia porcellus]|uniref:melanoma-associated antigen 10-like n=1 Tax=Cavia porcellus TaxID=10141 RepID=UPI00022B61FC|nr:melanoma-associated antigen 10-like [Cavia porcellus]
MPHGQRSQDSKLEDDHPGQSSTQVLMDEWHLKYEEEASATVSSTSSSSCASVGATSREEPGSETPNCPQNSESICCSPASIDSSQSSQSSEDSNMQEVEEPSALQEMSVPQILRSVLLNDKLYKLVPLLFCKYLKNEQVTMKEMQHIVDEDYREHFPLIFRNFCDCLRVGLGVDLSEVDFPGYTYELVPVMGLTYSGVLEDGDQVIAKVDLLILILSVIFIKGNRISEEDLRKQVKRWEILAETEEIVIGDPWKFVTEDLVREQYLEYRQVPDSDPAHYEFLWGPRAHAETTKMKILERMAKLNRMEPMSYSHLYVEAVKEEASMFRAAEGQDA